MPMVVSLKNDDPAGVLVATRPIQAHDLVLAVESIDQRTTPPCH